MMLAPHAKEVHAVRGDATLQDAAKAFYESGVGALIVVDDAGQPEGIVTDRDILRRAIAVAEKDLAALRVCDVMSAPLVTARATDPVAAVVALLEQHGIRRLPLEDDHGRIVGFVSFDDLVGEFADVGSAIARCVRRELRSARMAGRVEHLRDEVEHGLSDLHDKLARANWSARETFLFELDQFRDRVRDLFGRP